MNDNRYYTYWLLLLHPKGILGISYRFFLPRIENHYFWNTRLDNNGKVPFVVIPSHSYRFCNLAIINIVSVIVGIRFPFTEYLS